MPNSTSNECFLVVDLDAKIALLYLQGAFMIFNDSCCSHLCEVDQYYGSCLTESLRTGMWPAVGRKADISVSRYGLILCIFQLSC